MFECFAAEIKNIRLQKGFSEDYIEDLISCPINVIESNLYPPPLEHVVRGLCAALQLTEGETERLVAQADKEGQDWERLNRRRR